MRRLAAAVLAASLTAFGCDQPDEIYDPLPSNWDRAAVNGTKNRGTHYPGNKAFVDTEIDQPTGPSVEVCTDAEVSERWAAMVNEPILPMIGAGGLDMRGGDDWAGLTVDEAQSRDMLCQASYFDDTGVVAWGDYYEVIAFWDTTTREINDILVWPGYLGVIEAGDYVFEVNEPITRAGIEMSRNDGSDLDPKTDDNMRAIDRALIGAFRPGIDPAGVDCIAAGSCYIIDSGSIPVLVFTSVDMYVPLEPVAQHIVQLEVALKRPFRVGAGEIEVDGSVPTVLGTAAAGIEDCRVTFGTDWESVAQNCLGGDSLEMAEITPAFGYEQINVQFGGLLLYLDRPTLGPAEILPADPVPQAGDKVSIISVNAGYEGDFSMPFAEILEDFRDAIDDLVREEVPDLLPDDPTGAEWLRLPGDPAVPADVGARYLDRLRPGGVYAAFCAPDDDLDGTYDFCLTDASGRAMLPLTSTMRDVVVSTIGAATTVKLADTAAYVQQFLGALGASVNGAPLASDRINYSADAGSPDRIYATVTMPGQFTSFTFNAYYGGNDDRLHFMNFQRGGTRMEGILFADAALPTPSDPNPSRVFTMEHLIGSPYLGLGAVGTVTIDEVFADTRRALLGVALGGDDLQILAPYVPGSGVSGYWIPEEGALRHYQAADWFTLYGNTIDADFYLAPVPGTTLMEVVAIRGNTFFGDVGFCGFDVRIGDFADDLLGQIQDAGYPCRLDVQRSENRAFIISMADLDSQIEISVSNNQVNQVFAWAR